MTDPAAQPAPQPGAPLSAADDRLWGSLAHFLNIILLIPALIIYLVFKDRGTITRTEGKEALNWTINVSGALVAINIVNAIFGFIPILGAIVAILLGFISFAIIVVNVIFSIMGGVRVNAGGSYRYPFNIRWIK